MTSELSNALNPHVVQPRSRRRSGYDYNDGFSNSQIVEHPRAPPPPSPHVPHRSELELAVVEPPPPPPPRPPPQPPVGPVQRPANAIQELFRVVLATRQATEIERRRRLAWEQEQEAKYAHRQADMERQINDMQTEISLLKACVSMQAQQPQPRFNQDHSLMGTEHSTVYEPPLPASSAYIEEVPITAPTDAQRHFELPLSPVSQSAYVSSNLPTFIEGSSNQPFTSPLLPPAQTPQMLPSPVEVSTPAVTQTEEPASPAVQSPVPVPTSTLGKRRFIPAPIPSDSEEEESSDDESDTGTSTAPKKRKNGHDSRCLTIHHALRTHIFRCMKVKLSEDLPDSHIEGEPLDANEPVRFVWDKTTKQSIHNAEMKKRIIADLKTRRRLYKHVPDKDFNKKTLDTGFDQAFTTLRQKFKAQRDETAAHHNKRREEAKALKARRRERKKHKLGLRTDSRQKLDEFSHSTFDSALQIDCMSSEESCDEYSEAVPPVGVLKQVQVLRVRGLPWRSTRLLRFFATLDEEDKVDKSTKPKRGLGRKERCLGPPKEGFFMPPKGVASWMVSRRWVRDMVTSGIRPQLENELRKVVGNHAEILDWRIFHVLGADSEEEIEREVPAMEQQQYIFRPDTSSLAYALTPM